ncbi:hypothetical protein SAMN02910418_02359 [Bowdeniella nasicola]|uniref:Uncharacterized protein n=1 Tax=Bowdeniella nasicola TaxID=208480 RepID=A0A1H4DUP2_9ACTO|nr:hypothetical protein [Bowdeniella nasicola]SEA76306.1 hypothetical protein SAMN02910418_02359 [Bowdeniella nasicola]
MGDIPDSDDEREAAPTPENQSELEPATHDERPVLVEVLPGVAAIFGDVPVGMPEINLDILPELDRSQLSSVLATIGPSMTALGNAWETAARLKGLYKLAPETQKLIDAGLKLSVKDGYNISSIRTAKGFVQARFMKLGPRSPAQLASVGPAVAMLAVQAAVTEVAHVVQANIALTTHTLKAIRHEQWSQLEGLAEAIHEATKEARAISAVTESIWDPISPSGAALRQQVKLYRRNTANHLAEIDRLEGRERREYFEANGEAVVFDAYALLTSLRAFGEYQTLRVALARTRGHDDPDEVKVFDHLTKTVPDELQEGLRDVRALVDQLVRSLSLSAGLGSASAFSLSKWSRDARQARLNSAQLLSAIEPLADALSIRFETPTNLEAQCAPDGLEMDRYLRILQLQLDDGEELRGLAFTHVARSGDLSGVVPAVQAKRVDAAWGVRSAGKFGSLLSGVELADVVAVTNRRIIATSARDLLQRGEIDASYSLSDVKYVRPPSARPDEVRPTLAVTTKDDDLRLMFPQRADPQDIDDLAALIRDLASSTTPELIGTDGPSGQAQLSPGED